MAWLHGALVLGLAVLLQTHVARANECKVIDGDDLEFKQYTPREQVIRELLRRSVKEIRRSVKDVQELGFDIKGEDVKERVGRHTIKSTIQPSGECFVLNYRITPVNECEAKIGTSWRHQCHDSAICEDTEENYNCVCPEGMEGEHVGRCGGMTSTSQCCGATGGDACKHAFVCVAMAKTHDECKGQCVPEASCELLKPDHHIYGCRCPEGYFGNGRFCFRGQEPPTAIFDREDRLQGKMEEEDYCGCQVRKYDYCIGVQCGEHARCVNMEEGHECVCEEGYTEENGRCVDKKGVKLVLEGPEVVRLTQGDAYEDKLVRIQDENGMLQEPRHISITYDQPELNEDTLDNVGEYTISYQVRAHWTSTPTDDIDECAIKPSNPKYERWHHRCHKYADCINTIGSYKCQCRPGTVGDGAAMIRSRILAEGGFPPSNIQDGSGCRDVQPPTLEVSAWEKTFRTCKCEGLGGPMSPVPEACHARNYGQELSDLIMSEGLLCTAGWPCFTAYDDLPDGTRQDLKGRVKLGPNTQEDVDEGEKKGSHIRRFILPANVEDDAGNQATAYLKFSVEEISIWDLKVPDPQRAVPPEPPAPKFEPIAADEDEYLEEVQEDEKQQQQQEKEVKPRESTPPARQSEPSSQQQTRREEKEELRADSSSLTVLILFTLVVASLILWMCGGFGQNNAAADQALGFRPDGVAEEPFTYYESPTPNRSRRDSSLSTASSPLRPIRSPLTTANRTPFSPNF